MTDLFLKLLDMSLSASWIVLAVITARLVLKKAPRWMICGLWALVALRLVCPFSLESMLSLVPELPALQTTTEETLPNRVQNIIWDDSSVPGDRMTVAYPNKQGENVIYEVYLDEDGTTKAVEPRQIPLDWPIIATYIWVAGIAAMLIYAAASYLRIRKKVQVSINLGQKVFLCDYIDTPFILGIVKPIIYLPSAMDPKDAAHVLAHERAHLKRKDHWWKPLGYVLLCLYWFNPLLWVAYILLCRDIELACDERVVKDMGVTEKKAYSEALLKCSVPRHMIVACPLAFGEVGVKQRVKSVLHYKKPSFWVLLVSVIVIIVVAVCFLTDPESHTVVANILDMQPDKIDKILLWSKTSRADFETEEKIEEFLTFLDTLEYNPVPSASEPIEGDLDENNWSYYTIDIYYKDRTEYILFNYDYSLVWTRDANGTNSLPYRMKDPQRLLDYMNDHVTPVNNRETYADPFAKQDQPAQWLQGLSLDAIRAAKADNGYLSVARTAELVSILNVIPNSAISTPRFDKDFTFDYRLQSMPYIILRDGANDLTGILTYYNEAIELSLVGSSDYGMYPLEKQQYSGYICTIDSNALIAFFKELVKDPPNLIASSASGYLFREQLEVISDGNFTMSFHPLENWDYEIIPPEDEEDFFGFRCRPKKEEDGWITFGWWPDGVTPENVVDENYSNTYGYHYTYFRGSKKSTAGGEEVTTSYEQAHCDHGDFVTIFEKTDSWTQWYQDVATRLWSWINIKCEMPHSLTEVPDEIVSDLVNVAYYDWDSIAREIGTEHMTLFGPEYYEDYLFVGCQYEGGYHIACFRKIEGYDYEFVELLTPVSKPLPNESTQTIPVAEFETEDSPWYLYIIEDETVTGVKCNAGFWGYIPVDTSPALVVLDEALWGTDEESGIMFDLQYVDFPKLYFHANSNGSSFEFSTSLLYYLYDCIVNYNDGKDNLGAFSLEAEELRELSDLLLSLPELTENVFPENTDDPFALFPTNETGSKVYMQLYLDDSSLYLWSQDGVLRNDMDAIRLELYYSDGNITLGVNMTDLNNDFYRDVYYFKVENQELEDFILSKCDESRKRIFLSAE